MFISSALSVRFSVQTHFSRKAYLIKFAILVSFDIFSQLCRKT